MDQIQRVKIVATLGPASNDSETIAKLIRAGADVFRLNFSHGTHEEHRRVFETVRTEAQKAGEMIGILADLCGPKIRIGEMKAPGALLKKDDRITITTENVVGDAKRVSTSYTDLPEDVKKGDRILVDDGLLEFMVEEINGSSDVRCRVIVGGMLKSRKGMNIPNTPLSTPALTEKDREDLAFAKELGVDFFALSFVRKPEDVLLAKELAGDIPVIAKLEKPEAIESLDAVLDAADGAMVARGDLGVEAGAEKVPLLQKLIISESIARGKPVIVATQMLDSMIHNPRPTRAEVSDVAAAIFDGADAVMLSGETAAGAHPVEAVKEMAKIAETVEESEFFRRMPHPVRIDEYSFSNAIARSAVTAAEDLKLKAMAVYTITGHSASLVSACRPFSSIAALSENEEVLRRLSLRWGIRPFKAEWIEGVGGVVQQAEKILLEKGIVKNGEDIAITFGMQDMKGPGRTDVLKLWRIQG